MHTTHCHAQSLTANLMGSSRWLEIAPQGTQSYPRQGGREGGRQGGREAGREGGREAGREGGREGGSTAVSMNVQTVCPSGAASTTLTWWRLEGVWIEKGQQELQLVLLVNHPRHQQVVADLNQRSVVGSKLVVTSMPHTSTTSFPATMVLT